MRKKTTKKVYAVTAGSYSDYHIVGMYSNREHAEKYANAYTDCIIEEYDLDEPLPDLIDRGFVSYNVRMWKNGNSDVSKSTGASVDSAKYCMYNNRLLVVCLAKSEEHAVKIANEIRSMLIANNKWVTDYFSFTHIALTDDGDLLL